MSLFRRGEIWYASFTLPNGKRFKQSLGTKDKRQATELHDKLKAEAWRVSKLGEIPDITFEEACVLKRKHIKNHWTMTKAGSDSGFNISQECN